MTPLHAIHSLTHSLTLTQVGSITTQGGAGFEHIILDKKHYIASANFWNGIDTKMSAQSSLHAVEQLSSSNGLLSFPSVQSFMSYGGHGVDHFRVHVRNSMVEERESMDEVEVGVGECREGSICGWIQEMDLLVIPSYYGCKRGQTECNATHVYYHWNSSIHQFMDSISIPSSGPSQTDHFSTNRNSYLLIAENFINQLTMYRMDAMRIGTDDIDLQAVKVQGVIVPGIAACATAVIDGNTYVIAASYHDRGWQTTSTVYRLDEDSDALVIHHTIPTTGAHDVETIEYHGNHFLIFSEDRNSESVLISSNVSDIECVSRR